MTPSRQARLERVAAQASKQCGRSDVLVIEPETPTGALPDVLAPAPIFLALQDAPDPLVRMARLPAAVVIGPEGGLTPAEETALLSSGARPVSLARTVLRVETAAIAAAAVLVQADDRNVSPGSETRGSPRGTKNRGFGP